MLERSVICKKNADPNVTYRINVRIGILRLAVLSENAGSDFVDLADEFKHGVIGQLFQCKFPLGPVELASVGY